MPDGTEVREERPAARVRRDLRETRSRPWLGLSAAAIAVLALGFAIWRGIDGRREAEAALAVSTREQAVPVVTVVHPDPRAPDQALVLPGNTQAYINAPIYARTSGYLKRWYFDIGAHVRQGELLAEIETPEVDQQLRQARADLAAAQENSRLAAITAKRADALVRSHWVSDQERDNADSAYNAGKAVERSREAAVTRLEQLQAFERVYAPFDGIITARNTDVGHLINAGAGAPAAQLFDMAMISTLRIYVSVPESNAPAIRVGETVNVTLQEFPDETFKGKVVRTSNAIDPASRTLMVEVDVDNPDGRLLPGAYTDVHFALPAKGHSVTIPSNALLFRAEGLRVGVVRDGRAELVPIKIGRDYGDRVEVVSGLTAADEVIANPSDSLVSGTAVRVGKGRGGGSAS
jgi:RND family efflux transporter MFP subunit